MKRIDNEFSVMRLLRRLYWDLADKNERQYYTYWIISQIPGSFGNMLRGRFCTKRFLRAGKGLRVLAGARFRSMEKMEVGDNVSIGYDNFIQSLGGVKIGNNVSLAPNVKIWSVNHIFKDCTITINEQGQVKEPVLLGDDIWIGSSVFICPGVTLHDGVVVAAGSVVTKGQYEAYSILTGNPAKVKGFRERKG
jgi:acetyltransferase-like isoleucine patch superfamily enzyme